MSRLEQLVSAATESMRWYGTAIKENYRQMAPALAASTLIGATGQHLIGLTADPSELQIQLMGYGSAYATGWSILIGLEYRNRPERYPNGWFSKEMGKTVLDLVTADYVADMISYTPVFVGVNHLMLSGDQPEFLSGLAAGSAASITYFFVMCGLYSQTQRASSAINTTLGKAYTATRNIIARKNKD